MLFISKKLLAEFPYLSLSTLFFFSSSISSQLPLHPSKTDKIMYHPTRGGVGGGRDQFSWDDVKADKHRENYLGHSIKAPVGRWRKGKDLHWYVRDTKSGSLNTDALKGEIRRIKEEEEQAMREALGLAPKL